MKRVGLNDYLVGTGGWAYFPASAKPRLEAYSEIFNFVELNYTFYEYPDLKTVERWRRSVPKGFTFSVRCHQDLTHRFGLKPTNEAYQVLSRMLSYCGILEAPFLVLETPASQHFKTQTAKLAREFLGSANLRDVRLVWENRAPPTEQWKKLLQDLNIVHAVDLSKETPLFPSDVVYTRLFGKGRHNIYQFTDEELEEIDHKVLLSQAKTVAMSYHGLKMNTDAMRFVQFKKTGEFPSITGLTGVASAQAVLAEDATFSISKQELINKQGWKVFDASAAERLHLEDWLRGVPDKTYSSLDEVAKALEARE
jgi:uncharacterized protein YecE (DUF72 family)